MKAGWLEFIKTDPGIPEIELPYSKSISNRVLILEALSGKRIKAENHSDAADTLILKKILNNQDAEVYDVRDAGTVCRFITAFAFILNKDVIIKGTDRMHQRPIKGLVEALRGMGARIHYQEKDGYPPIHVSPGSPNISGEKDIYIKDTTSSQYISALMLIGAKVRDGLRIKFTDGLPSLSYIRMTAKVLEMAGLKCEYSDDEVYIPEQDFEKRKLIIEKDWSSASYFFPFLSLGIVNKLVLKDLKIDSIQEDSEIVKFFEPFGLNVRQSQNDLLLSAVNNNSKKPAEFDLRNNPDLSLTLAIAYALNKSEVQMTGLQNLVHKESDRIHSLQSELSKLNVRCTFENGDLFIDGNNLIIPDKFQLNTHNDHRMAMAFAPVSAFTKMYIDNFDVVRKSFPDFWNQIAKIGLKSHPVTH